MVIEPTQEFPLLWKALIFLFIFMIFGPVVQRILLDCTMLFTQGARFEDFVHQIQTLDYRETYQLLLPAQTVLGLALAAKVLLNRGVSLIFAIATAVIIFLLLSGYYMFSHAKAVTLKTISIDGCLWLLSTLLCWNFARLFHAQLPLAAPKNRQK